MCAFEEVESVDVWTAAVALMMWTFAKDRGLVNSEHDFDGMKQIERYRIGDPI